MFQLLGQPLCFSAYFADDSGDPLDEGAGISVSVFRINADGTKTDIGIVNEPANSTGSGLWTYQLPFAPNVAGTYWAIFVGGGSYYHSHTDKWHVGLPWLQTVYSKTNLIGATVGEIVDGLAIFGDTLELETDCRYEKLIQFSGLDLTGWTSISFTIKESADEDEDSESLLTVAITNPAAVGTDGIKVHRRNALPITNALRTKGALEIVSIGPDAIVKVVLASESLDLPPSDPTTPYKYEIDVWIGDKNQIAKGDLKLNRSVRRSPTTP